jgi:hypothetical protein
MERLSLNLSVLEDKLSVCQLGPSVGIPTWAQQGKFYSISRTEDELSIVCSQDNVPDGIKCDSNWRALKVEGPLDFSLIGILASLANTLANVEISIFAISTYDTDYLLVKEDKLERAIEALQEAGHQVR